MSWSSARLFDDATCTAASFPPPRPFQVTAHEALRQGARTGHKNQLLMAPTGAGKTYLGLRLAHEAMLKGKRAVFVCDRTTLINQTSQTADRYGLAAHGIVQANHWRRDTSLPLQIASAQTLAKRDYWPAADVIIIDEAHTKLRVWVEHIQRTEAVCIGLSATPFSPGLGKLFTNLVNATTMHELTQSGVLVPMRVLSCTRINMDGAATAGGEWTDTAAAERGLAIVGDVVSEWAKHAQQRKTIVFGANIAHCLELCRQFVDAGIMAAAFTANTSSAEREVLLREYRKPDAQLRVLISVEALAKGFDVPDVGCVVDCRPLRKSLSSAIQMWGRGLRASPATGKIDCLLLDHSGNIVRFLDDFTEIYFNGLSALDAGEDLDKAVRRDQSNYEPKPCPACGYVPFSKRCMACGFERQPLTRICALPGEMQEVIVAGKKLADDQEHLWAQLCSYACTHSSPDKQRGRAWHLYRQITGSEPPKDWSFDSSASVAVTDHVRNRITSLNLRHLKRRRA
ncbi:DEAD/DEAH box helicase family protein [Ramlibacter tataouinensis]|uniref:DEAD/DEAH box helicase n=1 Tax=Ramlibacter tataouinensis TaxID=94132 RepID=UPI0022F40101|nr:DEAD/DEAH box helicase family protein [Ramlibacter tataouinensis]WBY00518.1 DEAD/DEAH box helicase family protein [Ramlibacter tataouinensis]